MRENLLEEIAMSAIPNEPIRMSESEYLEFERQNEFKHEYINGEVFAMAGASREYLLLCTALSRLLANQLDDRDCEVYSNDIRVKAEKLSSYYYPDVVVVCGEPKFIDKVFDTLTNPTVIIEVLSPSTKRFDANEKFADYRRMDSVQEYLLVYQDKARIEHYFKNSEGKWEVEDLLGLEATLQLTSIDCELKMADIYKKLKLSPKKANP
jgi:Uma2 family endonuclease